MLEQFSKQARGRDGGCNRAAPPFAHTTEMLEHVTERDELLKRHGDAMKQLSASLDTLLGRA